MSKQKLPEVPYGPPVERGVAARRGFNKDAAKVAVRVAAPFVIGAILKALAKR